MASKRIDGMEAAQARLEALVRDAAEPRSRISLVPLAAFAITLVAACAGLERLLAHAAPAAFFERDSLESDKYTSFARQADDYDLVFVGTSRVYRQFDAEHFDRVMAAHGTELRSFNFGMGGMRYFELRETVRSVLEREPERLRWLLIDLTGDLAIGPRGPIHSDKFLSSRVIKWHRTGYAWLAVRAAWASTLSTSEKLEATLAHVHQWGLRFANVGLAASALKRHFHPTELAPGWNGYRSLEDEDAPELRRDRQKRRKQRHLARNLAALAAETPGDPLGTNELWFRDLADWVAEIRSAGVEPVFVALPPHWFDDIASFDPSHLDDVTFLDYRDPERYPDFYTAERLHNINHLDSVGSRLLTGRIAQDLAPILRAARERR